MTTISIMKITPLIQTTLWLMSSGVVTSNILVVVLVAGFIVFLIVKKPPMFIRQTVKFISDNSIVLSWIVATIATVSSLFLSEVAGFTPCELCWYQRICMYPQAIILGIATFTNDTSIKKYSIIFVGTGGFGIPILEALAKGPKARLAADAKAALARLARR